MRILGVDPGLKRTGYAVLEAKRGNFKVREAGIIETSYRQPTEHRVRKIHQALVEIIRDFSPDTLVLEKLYSHYKHRMTAVLMGHARGIIYLAAAEQRVPLVNYSATRIKKAVTGNGRASKGQIQRTVKHLLNLKKEIKYSDVSDALALALGHIYISGHKL